MKKLAIIAAIVAISALAYAQHRRQYVPCPIDGAMMQWTGNQKGSGNFSSCEFSHTAYENNHPVEHTTWASCSE